MTRKQYLVNSKMMIWTARVLDIVYGETIIVRLDRTIFHPQGGGQKADRGRIGPAMVIHVAHNADRVDHHVENAVGLEVGAEVRLEIDEAWRQLNATYHTAGHLLASVVEAMYPRLRAVSGHQWPGEGRVEFVSDASSEQIYAENINVRLAADIETDLPVIMEGDPFNDRMIKIGSYAPIPCGGTHVSRLGEIASVVVKSVKAKGGRIRISYDASPRYVA